jgi:hypothetical protein
MLGDVADTAACTMLQSPALMVNQSAIVSPLEAKAAN